MKGAILLSTGNDAALGGNEDRNSAIFRTAFPDRTITTKPEAGVEYAVVWKPPQNLLAQLPDLKVVFSLGAGVDHVINDPTLPAVPLVRFVDPDLTGRMAEWVALQVLTHHRRALAYRAQQLAKTWKDLPAPPAKAVTVGIMGFGVLGQASAKVLLALDYKVLAWSRSGTGMAGVEAYGVEQREAFLRQCDIVVCLLPLTPDTTAMIDRTFFDMLPAAGPLGAPVLINAGRGKSQIDGDIAAALRDGRLGGASLDVFEVEPLPETNPLWDAPNCIITPHAAAESEPSALAAYVKRQVERFEAGKKLENVVDRQRGY